MQIYMVGGAVRDRLLGLPVNDRDWVVVGATPEQMQALGYLPVARTSLSSCTPKRTRNTPWPAPSARPRPATRVLLFTPRRT